MQASTPSYSLTPLRNSCNEQAKRGRGADPGGTGPDTAQDGVSAHWLGSDDAGEQHRELQHEA